MKYCYQSIILTTSMTYCFQSIYLTISMKYRYKSITLIISVNHCYKSIHLIASVKYFYKPISWLFQWSIVINDPPPCHACRKRRLRQVCVGLTTLPVKKQNNKTKQNKTKKKKTSYESIYDNKSEHSPGQGRVSISETYEVELKQQGTN